MERIEVIVRKNDSSLARYLLAPGEYVVGRDADCEIQIDCPDVSRHHARLTITADDFKIEDMASTSGTLVAGEPISQSTTFKAPKAIQIGGAMVHINTLTGAELSSLTVTVEPKPAPLPPPIPTEPARPVLPPFAKAIQKARNYEVGKELSHGGMGAVLEAQDLNIDRAVAMKVILPARAGSATMLQRFIQEAQVLGRLEHPNIVPIHELGTDAEGRVFYTMKYVRGETLQGVLNQIKAGDAETIRKYPLSQLLTIFQKVCDAVGFAHSKGVVHRDLKPENIMIGEFGEVLVMDWGIAKILGSAEKVAEGRGGQPSRLRESEPWPTGTQSQTIGDSDFSSSTPEVSGESAGPNAQGVRDSMPLGRPPTPFGELKTLEGQLLGTPNFMSPEQAEGRISDIDARTDSYSLGGILYSILTLRPPIHGSSLAEMLGRITRGEIRPPTDFNEFAIQAAAEKSELPTAEKGLPHCPDRRIPPALSAVAMKALSLRSKDRYRSMEELQKDIAAYQNGFITSAEQPSPWRLARLWVRRHRLAFSVLAGLIGVAAIFSVAVIAMWLELHGTASTFYEKSQTLVAANKFKDALPPIDYAIRLDSRQASYHLLRGHVLESLLDLDGARAAYESALRIEPGHQLASENLKLCRDILQSITSNNEVPTSALAGLHAAMLRQGRRDEANAMLKLLLASGAVPRKEFYDSWRAKLDQAGLDGTLTVDDAGRVEFRSSGESRVTDISVLRGMPLNGLNLVNERVTNLSALAGMPLDTLQIGGLAVTDLSPLKGMRLKILTMHGSHVADISPLVGMPLETVHLGPFVKNIRALAGMPIRDLESVGVNDVRTLSTLPLEILGFDSCDISDLAPLREIATLRYLILQNCKNLKSLEPLRGMPLTYLRIDRFPITDLAPLKGMRLQGLDLFEVPITSLSPIEGMPMGEFSLRTSRVSDLSPLAGMPLDFLNLSDSPVTDLSILPRLKISRLIMTSIPVTDFSPLASLKLIYLRLSNTKFSDLALLRNQPIRELFLDGCGELSDLTQLSEFRFLETLTIPAQSKDIHFLRQMPSLKRLGFTEADLRPPAEFWKAYEVRKK